VRRRRVVRVQHRVVCGTLAAVQQGLALCGWQIHTACVACLHLESRQRVAAVGRRGNTVCQGEEGGPHQLVFLQSAHNFGLPHASVRQPLRGPAPTHGSGSATRGRPWTPAMAAGLTDHGWSLQEGRLLRVPPWPQPQAL
jgi:hypothetical protein